MVGAIVPLSQPSDVVAQVEIRLDRQRNRLESVQRHRQQAPSDQDHDHDGGDLHDAQRLHARFVHAQNVLAPEVQGREHGEPRGEIRRMEMQSS